MSTSAKRKLRRQFIAKGKDATAQFLAEAKPQLQTLQRQIGAAETALRDMNKAAQRAGEQAHG